MHHTLPNRNCHFFEVQPLTYIDEKDKYKTTRMLEMLEMHSVLAFVFEGYHLAVNENSSSISTKIRHRNARPILS